VTSSEIWKRYTVLDRRQREAEFVDKDGASIGTCNTMQAIKENLEILCVLI
jgi:hypothetical protein